MTVEQLMETLATLPKTATVILAAWPMELLEALEETAEGDAAEFGIESATYEHGEAVIRLGEAPKRASRLLSPGPERPQ